MLNWPRRSVKFGGIRPRGHKQTSLRSRIMPTPLPRQLTLALRQHQGSESIPCVGVGDQVLKYQLLARAGDEFGLNLHAPTSGTIVSVDETRNFFNTSETQRCLILQCDDRDEALTLDAPGDHRKLGHRECIDRIGQAGICGLAGNGFPTALKLRRGVQGGVQLLLINAAECEPYITCDESLIRERTSEVVSGAEILQSACLASRCMIVIEENKKDAIASLRSELTSSSVELLIVSTRYPAGDENQIVYSATGMEVPRGGLPVDVGVLVINAATAAACYSAVVLGQPCVSRITTLTGQALQTPKNFDVPIGTAVAHLLKLCGINRQQHHSTVIGGSFMGQFPTTPTVPVSKTTNCIIAASPVEFPRPEQQLACIRCGFCADVCPAHLLPQQLLCYSKTDDLNMLEEHGIFDCIECGACAWVCPSKIPLVQYYRSSKEQIRIESGTGQLSAAWQERFQYWQYRRKKSKEPDREQRLESEAPDIQPGNQFSRDMARKEIAAAVARVKRKQAEREQ